MNGSLYWFNPLTGGSASNTDVNGPRFGIYEGSGSFGGWWYWSYIEAAEAGYSATVVVERILIGESEMPVVVRYLRQRQSPRGTPTRQRMKGLA